MIFDMNGRQCGKSYAAELAKEHALDAGKRVLAFTPKGITIQRRKKHLTLIEYVQKKEPVPLVFYDDYYI